MSTCGGLDVEGVLARNMGREPQWQLVPPIAPASEVRQPRHLAHRQRLTRLRHQVRIDQPEQYLMNFAGLPVRIGERQALGPAELQRQARIAALDLCAAEHDRTAEDAAAQRPLAQ